MIFELGAQILQYLDHIQFLNRLYPAYEAILSHVIILRAMLWQEYKPLNWYKDSYLPINKRPQIPPPSMHCIYERI